MIKPRKPKITKIDPYKIKLLKIFKVSTLILLGITVLHILLFYAESLFYPMVETVSVRYAIYIAIGCFYCRFIYKSEIEEMFKPKDLPPIENQ